MIQQLELDIFKLAPASRRLTSQMRNHGIKEIHHDIVGQEWGRNFLYCRQLAIFAIPPWRR
jgi:hypothetical protein